MLSNAEKQRRHRFYKARAITVYEYLTGVPMDHMIRVLKGMEALRIHDDDTGLWVEMDFDAREFYFDERSDS